jgi:peroxiredoxin Q/BCP
MVGSRKRIANGIAGLLLLCLIAVGATLGVSMGSKADLVSIGQPAPDFTTITSDGSTVHLSALQRHKRVVLVFYPGDYTPVCTAQLCSFRDNWEALQAEDAVVYGINPAPREKHAGFAAQNSLPFPLIVDSDGEIARRYGCRALFGIVKRTVYVVDGRGRVVWAERGNPSPLVILQVLHGLKDDAYR